MSHLPTVTGKQASEASRLLLDLLRQSGRVWNALRTVKASALDHATALPTLARSPFSGSPGRIAKRLAGASPLGDPALLFAVPPASNAGSHRELPMLGAHLTA